MKHIKIYKYEVGLVFRDGHYVRTLCEGSHWLKFSEVVKLYNMSQYFTPPCEFSILQKDPELIKLLTVIEVKDSEIALYYVQGNLKNVLAPGIYTFWKGVVECEFITIDLESTELIQHIQPSVLQRKELMNYIKAFSVEAFEAALLFVDGKFRQMLEPGVHYFWRNATPIKVLTVDLRNQQMEVSGQEILTKDKAQLRISFYVQYRVVDVMKALLENKEYEKQLYTAVQLALREYIGMQTLDELLERKELASEYMLTALAEVSSKLGVEIAGCGIRDVILPGEVKEIMNQVLVAEKRAQANIITRREETASTRSLLNTAKLLEENAMLFKLKEMEYVEKIADKINTISLSGGGKIVDQLKELFSPGKTN